MPIISLMALRACSCIGIIVLLSVRTIQKPKIFYRSDDILVYSDQTSSASKSFGNMLHAAKFNVKTDNNSVHIIDSTYAC